MKFLDKKRYANRTKNNFPLSALLIPEHITHIHTHLRFLHRRSWPRLSIRTYSRENPSIPPGPFLFHLFVCYERLCTAGNRLSVYSGSVSAEVRATTPLRPRIVKDDALFTTANVALVPRTHIFEIKFPVLCIVLPLSSAVCSPRTLQRMAYLRGVAP